MRIDPCPRRGVGPARRFAISRPAAVLPGALLLALLAMCALLAGLPAITWAQIGSQTGADLVGTGQSGVEDQSTMATTTISVLPFEINAGPELDYLHTSLPQLLGDTLRSKGFKVVEFDNVMDVIVRENVQYVDLQTARDIALLTGANYAVYGSFTQAGETLSLDVRLVEAFGLKPDKPLFVTKQGLINVLPAIEELADKIRLELLKKEQISDIEVIGTRALDEDVVLLRLQSRKGDVYNPATASEDLKRVYDLGYFDDVKVNVQDTPTGKQLIFEVTEKPRIQSISVTGNDEIDDDDIITAMSTKVGSVLNLKVLAEDLNKIRELYRRDGFYLAKVDYALADSGQGSARLEIKVDEGQKLYIKEVRIEGTDQLDADELKGELALSERGMLSFITGTGVLKEELLERDAAAIEAYYANRGFIDVKVGQPEVDFQEDGIVVTFHVSEGPRYKIGEVKFGGDMLEDEETLRGLTALDELAAEDAYLDRSVVRRDAKALTDYYTDYGYAYADATTDLDVDREKHTVGVTYNLKKNERVFIRRVVVEGNTKTRENVVLREMRLGDGDQFSGSALARSHERLSRLDFFKSVDFETVPTGSPSEVDLKIKVAEKPTGSLSAGAGYSNLDKVFFGGSIEERNLFGRGYQLAFGAKLGARNNNFNLSFVNPRLYNTELMIGGDAYITKTEYDDYTRDAVGAKLRTGYPLGEYTRFFANYKLERYDLKDIDSDAAALIREFQGRNWSSVIQLSAVRDTTNDRFLPNRGTVNSLSFEYGGGILQGNDNFTKTVYSSDWFKELWWTTVLHLHGQVGFVTQNFTGEDIPPFERFYLGGIGSVRGYAGRSISPEDPESGDLIGGTSEFIASVEYLFPVYTEMMIEGLVFFDMGNTWDSSTGGFFSQNGVNNEALALGLYKSVGVGIRWNSPLGPLRVEYGWPLDEAPDGSNTGKIEFAVGATF